MPAVLDAASARAAREASARSDFAAGRLSLDLNGLRDRLPELGIRYLTHDEYTAADGNG